MFGMSSELRSLSRFSLNAICNINFVAKLSGMFLVSIFLVGLTVKRVLTRDLDSLYSCQVSSYGWRPTNRRKKMADIIFDVILFFADGFVSCYLSAVPSIFLDNIQL